MARSNFLTEQPKSTHSQTRHVRNGQAQRVRSATEHHVELSIGAMPKEKSKKAKVKPQEPKHTQKQEPNTTNTTNPNTTPKPNHIDKDKEKDKNKDKN